MNTWLYSISVLFLCIKVFAAQDGWAEQRLKMMTLEEKIGQLMIVAVSVPVDEKIVPKAHMDAKLASVYDTRPEYIEALIEKYGIGGVVFLFTSQADKQILCTRQLQSKSKIPLFVAQDLEWGLNMRMPEQIPFARALTLGAVADTHLIYELGREIARQCCLLGVHINLAPVADVNINQTNPVIGMRSFGQDPERVAQAACAYARGLADGGVIGCAKHFPGHGDTSIDSHYDLPVIAHTRQRFESVEWVPFKQLIQGGIAMIMSAHVLVPAFDDVPVTWSSKCIDDVLSNELGFTGLKITDGLGMRAIIKQGLQPGQVELKALLAGHDLLLCPVNVPAAVERIKEAVESGILDEATLDVHVLKILQLKEFLCQQGRFAMPDKASLAELETEHTRALKQMLYTQAVTVVRDPESVFGRLNNFCTIQVGGDEKTRVHTLLPDAPAYYYSSDCNLKPEQLIYELANRETVVLILCGTPAVGNRWTQSFCCINELLAQAKRVVVLAFENPYNLIGINEQASLIVGYECDIDSQQAAANVVLGVQKAVGVMPLTMF